MTVTTNDIVPGVYEIPAEDYHADPVPGGSLSSSGARKLLPPNCPAKFAWERDNRPAPKREFDLGHAAHKLVLGVGPDLVVIHAENYRTKAAQKKQKEAHEAGRVPLLVAEHKQVQAMADALRAHPTASKLFDPAGGQPERALIWQDPQTGVWRRALLDWLPNPRAGRMIVPDYKTTQSAAPAAVQRAVYSYGYHCQGGWYLDGVRDLCLAEDAAFVLVCQEKDPPYLVNVVQVHPEALRLGGLLNRHAIDIYRECTATGIWPGYGDDVALVTLPPWAENRYYEEIL